MSEIASFYQLKEEVLSRYKESFPYFTGNWKSFSSQDITNLIEDIYSKTKSTVSEKWIYTHLKPEHNEKLPRKNMLDILCQYTNGKNWDEYIYYHLDTVNIEEKSTENEIEIVDAKNKKKRFIQIVSVIVVFFVGIIAYFFLRNEQPIKTKLEFNNGYTNDKVYTDEVKVYKVDDSTQSNLISTQPKIEVTEPIRVIVKSPLYKTKNIALMPGDTLKKIELYPNDYAMILNAFMKSDIKDWKTRKEQLGKILSDDVEVLVMLKNNLGIEYLNKEEFTQKIVVPTASLKKMKIIELKSDVEQKVSFLRIATE